jgi:hypothetical protein
MVQVKDMNGNEKKKLFLFCFLNFVSELQFFKYQNKKGGRLSTIAIYDCEREASIKIILIT